jgi:four helix bundle protein
VLGGVQAERPAAVAFGEPGHRLCAAAAGWAFSKGEGPMLQIYPFIRETIRLLRPVVELIERRDADLGRQARRAATSIILNTGEGMFSRGRCSNARYHSAAGSARELLSCTEAASDLGYCDPIDAELDDRLRKIVHTLARLAVRAA